MAALDACAECKQVRDVEARTYNVVTKDFLAETVTKPLCQECWEEAEGIPTPQRLDRARQNFCAQRELAKLRRVALERDRAPGRRLHWNEVDEEAFAQLVREPCFFCGYLPRPPSAEEWRTVINTLHRLVSTGPFAEGNVLGCCSTCNLFKGDTDFEAFLEGIALEVLDHREQMLAAMAEVSQERLNIAQRRQVDFGQTPETLRLARSGYIARHMGMLA